MYTLTDNITFAAYMRATRTINVTQDMFVKYFSGTIANPGDLWDRMEQGRYADVVIPYRSVLKQCFLGLIRPRKQRTFYTKKQGTRTFGLIDGVMVDNYGKKMPSLND